MDVSPLSEALRGAERDRIGMKRPRPHSQHCPCLDNNSVLQNSQSVMWIDYEYSQVGGLSRVQSSMEMRKIHLLILERGRERPGPNARVHLRTLRSWSRDHEDTP